MYGLKMNNGAVVGRMSLARAFRKFERNPGVVEAVMRLVDSKQIRTRTNDKGKEL